MVLSDVDGLPHERQMKERFPLFMHNVAEPFAAVVPSIDKILEAEPHGHRCKAEARDGGENSCDDGGDCCLRGTCMTVKRVSEGTPDR